LTREKFKRKLRNRSKKTFLVPRAEDAIASRDEERFKAINANFESFSPLFICGGVKTTETWNETRLRVQEADYKNAHAAITTPEILGHNGS
jgi:uncharacterized protein YlaI